MMFEWLEEELRTIRTKRFHIVDGPASRELENAILKNDVAIPASYKSFVLRFGNAKLFRLGSIYQIGVLASPRRAEAKSGETVFQIGHFLTSRAYVFGEKLDNRDEAPVFEASNGLRKIAGSFVEWLDRRAETARKKYGKLGWKSILEGPETFSSREQEIVEARKRFRWSHEGVDETGALLFAVSNDSGLILPYLSIGVRSKDGKLNGGVWLPIGSVRPGQSEMIRKACYTGLVAPEELEAYELPEPEPEDREQYWEFRASPT